MSREALVSVIICIYGGERFLRQTLESALAQTYRHWEIIAVDDGSPDRSVDIVRQFGDSRIRLLRQANAGAASALAAGIGAASGEYVALLDQDDLWDRESLGHHVRCLDSQPGIDLTFSWFRMVDDQGRDLRARTPRHRGAADFETLLQDNVIGASSNVVARRAAILQAGGPDLSLPRLYDIDLCLRIALLRPGNVMAIPRELMFYRRHPNQMTRNLPALRSEWARLLVKLDRIRPLLVAAVKRHAESNTHRYFAFLAYESGQYRTSMRLLGQGFRFAPAFFLADRRTWLVLAAASAGVFLPDRIRLRLKRLVGLRTGTHPTSSASTDSDGR